MIDKLVKKCLLTEEMRTIARCMITASHYNNLPDKDFDLYLNEILTKALPIIKEELEKERLDRPDREKIVDLMYLWDTKPFKDKSHYEQADQLLALIPDERKAVAEEILDYMENNITYWEDALAQYKLGECPEWEALKATYSGKAILDKLKGEK